MPLAWHNLTHNKSRMLAAVSGIAFISILIFAKLGVRTSITNAAMLVYDRLNFDIIIVSPHYANMGDQLGTIPRSRLSQALSFKGVESVMPIYIALPTWRNLQTGFRDAILMLGFNPRDRVFLVPELNGQAKVLQKPDTLLIDRRSRAKFGSHATGTVAEIEGRKLTIAGQFTLGTGFAALGTIIVSDQTFSRVMNNTSLNQVNFGLVTLAPGTAIDAVAQGLRHLLPPDVRVLTHAELQAIEIRYWFDITATGIMINSGVLMACIVGTVILYQVLVTDISNRLSEYATLKALGYKGSYLSWIVLQQAIILALLGFIPAFFLSFGIYEIIQRTAHIDISMTLTRGLFVFSLVIGMVSLSGLLALQKVRKADPAELF